MRLLFLILLIVTNVHAMKRQDDNTYSYNPKYDIIEENGHQDPIFITKISWFSTLMIRAGENENGEDNYLSFDVRNLHTWLIEQGKEKIPGIEIKATEVQKELVKLYYDALPLIGNRTAEEIEDIAVKLFEIHLTGKYSYDDSLRAFLTDKKNELNEEGLIIVKRFIRFHNIEKVYTTLELSRNEAREPIFNNLPESTMHKPYALRQSLQRNIDGKALTGRIILCALNDEEITQIILHYHSGEGFYVTNDDKKNIYFSNFLDLIDNLHNNVDIKNFLTYSSIKNTAPQNWIDTVHINNNGNIKKLSITYLYEKNEPYDGIILNDKQKDLISFYFSCINLLPDNMKDNKDKINEIVSVLFSLDLNEHEHEIASIIDDLLTNNVELYKPISNFIDDKGKLNDKGKNFLRRFLTLDHVTRFTNEAKQSKNNTYSKLHTWLKLMMSDAEILGLDILQRTIIQ